MRQIFIPVILICAFQTAFSADGSRLKRFERNIREIEPFTSHFTQMFYDAFQDRTVTSEGTLTFMQPGLMRWQYETPEEMLFIIGREKVWLYDPVLENVTIQSLGKVSGIRSLRFLSGEEKLSELFRDVKTERRLVDDFPDAEAIFLKPLEENASLYELQLVLNMQKNLLLQFVIIDHNSNIRKVTLKNIKTLETVDKSMFRFEVTEGMEVIQGMAN